MRFALPLKNGARRPKAALLGVVLPLFLVGCVKDYVPPTTEQPHALLKFRRRYKEPLGSNLAEELRVNKERAFESNQESTRAQVPRTDAVLVHPGPALLKFQVGFFHTETRTRQDSYSCGTSSAPRTCYRTVTENYQVADGHCEKEVNFSVETGEVYLWSLDYKGRKNCTLSCFKQTTAEKGKFENERCEFELLDD